MRSKNRIRMKDVNGRPNVLFVDDDGLVLFLLEKFCIGQKFNPIFVCSAEEAEKKIEAYQIDLICLDIMMPKVTGFELCEKIREFYTKSELPIIFFTASSSKEEIESSITSEKGANDYIFKPFKKGELIAKINLHLLLTSK